MAHYEYEFEVLALSAGGYSLFGGVGIRTEGHQEVIRSRAAAGWRYVGYLPSVQRASGHIETIELVFEREIEQEYGRERHGAEEDRPHQ